MGERGLLTLNSQLKKRLPQRQPLLVLHLVGLLVPHSERFQTFGPHKG